MPNDQDKLAATHLRMTTPKDPERIRSAAARAQEAGKRTMSSSIKLKGEGERHLTYSVRGPGGVAEIASFELSWDGTDGDHMVVTTMSTYNGFRQKMLGLIPVGAVRIPALKSYSQFTDWMRKELAA